MSFVYILVIIGNKETNNSCRTILKQIESNTVKAIKIKPTTGNYRKVEFCSISELY